ARQDRESNELTQSKAMSVGSRFGDPTLAATVIRHEEMLGSRNSRDCWRPDVRTACRSCGEIPKAQRSANTGQACRNGNYRRSTLGRRLCGQWRAHKLLDGPQE